MSESPSYEHSRVFAQMKAVKESIQGNLTTHQYLRTLDTYLARALDPILVLNNNFSAFLSQLLFWQELNPKRKVSLLSKEDFRLVALRYLAKDSTDWTSLKLDRLLTVQYIESQVKLYQPIVNYHDGNVGLTNVNKVWRELQAATQGYVLPNTDVLLDSVKSSQYWLNAALTFKNQVLEKYYRLCLRTAQQDYVDYFAKKCKLDDVIQVYVQAASRALDKCDATQGVLTTHIQYWLYTARTSVVKSMPQEVHLEESMPTEASGEDADEAYSLEAQLETQDAANEIAALLAVIDPRGAARAYLGINETVETLNDPRPYLAWRSECQKITL